VRFLLRPVLEPLGLSSCVTKPIGRAGGSGGIVSSSDSVFISSSASRLSTSALVDRDHAAPQARPDGKSGLKALSAPPRPRAHIFIAKNPAFPADFAGFDEKFCRSTRFLRLMRSFAAFSIPAGSLAWLGPR
jgi:hypothetical protein